MKKRAVLSATGRDRIGVVDDLGAALSERHIRIRDSRMTSLGGRFSAIIELCGDHHDVTRLQRDLIGLGRDFGFELQLDQVAFEKPRVRRPRLVIESFTAELAALNAVTGVLKLHHVNIDELATETSVSAFDCEPSFRMTVRATVPVTVSVDELTRELRKLEHERDLDIVIRTPELASPSPVGG